MSSKRSSRQRVNRSYSYSRSYNSGDNILGEVFCKGFLELVLVSMLLLYVAQSVLRENDQNYDSYVTNLTNRYDSDASRNVALDYGLFLASVSILFSLIFTKLTIMKSSSEAAVYGAVLGSLISLVIVSIVSICDLTFPVRSGVLIGVAGGVVGVFLTMWKYFRSGY